LNKKSKLSHYAFDFQQKLVGNHHCIIFSYYCKIKKIIHY